MALALASLHERGVSDRCGGVAYLVRSAGLAVDDLSGLTVAYAAYRNGLARAEAELEPEEFVLYLEDLAKARAAVEVAWLERGVAGQVNPEIADCDLKREERHGANSERPTFGPVESIGRTTSSDGGVW